SQLMAVRAEVHMQQHAIPSSQLSFAAVSSSNKLVTIDGLILKVAQRCNLACSYCYMYEHVDKSYRTKPPLMSDDVLRRTIIRTKEYLDKKPRHRLTITFHGGEPTLIGVKRFRR